MDVLYRRSMMAAVLGILGDSAARKSALSSGQQAEGYALPYLFKEGSIKSGTPSKDELSEWKGLLDQAKSTMLASK